MPGIPAHGTRSSPGGVTQLKARLMRHIGFDKKSRGRLNIHQDPAEVEECHLTTLTYIEVYNS